MKARINQFNNVLKTICIPRRVKSNVKVIEHRDTAMTLKIG